MSMGYGACGGYIIKGEDLAAIGNLKEKVSIFKNIVEDLGATMNDVAEACEYETDIHGINEQENKQIAVLYELIRKEFEKETGLRVYLGSHNSEDEGSRYDEVNGAFWWVSGMRTYTPEGEKMKDIIKKHSWVRHC